MCRWWDGYINNNGDHFAGEMIKLPTHTVMHINIHKGLRMFSTSHIISDFYDAYLDESGLHALVEIDGAVVLLEHSFDF